MTALLCRLSNTNAGNLEDTLQDDDTVYQKLTYQNADTSGPDSISSRTSKGHTFRGQKALLCWWLCWWLCLWLCCWLCHLNIRSGDRLRWNGLGPALTSRSSRRYGGWVCSSCHHWCYLLYWNTTDMVSEAQGSISSPKENDVYILNWH